MICNTKRVAVFRCRTAALFSEKELPSKFRQIGVLYAALDAKAGAGHITDEDQIKDAMKIWLTTRFKIPETGRAIVR